MISIADKKAKLIQKSASEVRHNKALFADFIEVYVAEGGRKQECMSCAFKGVFERWKLNSNTILKTSKMSKSNTFKLRDDKTIFYVPGGGGVVTKNSPDELVFELFKRINPEILEKVKSKFEKLPEEPKKKVKSNSKKENSEVKKDDSVKEISPLEKASVEYKEKFGKKVPNKFKNDLEWILNRIGKE